MIDFAQIFVLQRTDQTRTKINGSYIIIHMRKQWFDDQKRMLNKHYNIEYDNIKIYTR